MVNNIINPGICITLHIIAGSVVLNETYVTTIQSVQVHHKTEKILCMLFRWE